MRISRAQRVVAKGIEQLLTPIIAVMRAEWKRRNRRIHGYGDPAVVTFDCAHGQGNEAATDHKQSRPIVRTESGWRVALVACSVNLPTG